MPPSLRPAILLVAAVSLCSAARAAADDGSTFLPPGTASPFPFCPARPPGFSSGPFPWSTPPPPPPQSEALLPQDPGFLSSGVCPAVGAVAWRLPLLAVSSSSAFLMLLQ